MNPGFNGVWGNLIYRNILMHEAYMPKTWRFLPDFDKNIDNSSIVPHKKNMKLKMHPLEWGTRLMYSSCVVFNSANQNEQPERFVGNLNSMECSNAAAERHILQSFRD